MVGSADRQAEALLEQGRTNIAKNAEARTWLVKARRVDPNNPSIFYFNYLSYAQEGGGIPEQAIIGLEQSFKEAPYDDEVRLALIGQFLAEKNGPVARQLMAPLVHSPHESKGAKALRRIYDLIGANKLDEAYKGLVAEVAAEEKERKAGKECGG